MPLARLFTSAPLPVTEPAGPSEPSNVACRAPSPFALCSPHGREAIALTGACPLRLLATRDSHLSRRLPRPRWLIRACRVCDHRTHRRHPHAHALQGVGRHQRVGLHARPLADGQHLPPLDLALTVPHRRVRQGHQLAGGAMQASRYMQTFPLPQFQQLPLLSTAIEEALSLSLPPSLDLPAPAASSPRVALLTLAVVDRVRTASPYSTPRSRSCSTAAPPAHGSSPARTTPRYVPMPHCATNHSAQAVWLALSLP